MNYKNLNLDKILQNYNNNKNHKSKRLLFKWNKIFKKMLYKVKNNNQLIIIKEREINWIKQNKKKRKKKILK